MKLQIGHKINFSMFNDISIVFGNRTLLSSFRKQPIACDIWEVYRSPLINDSTRFKPFPVKTGLNRMEPVWTGRNWFESVDQLKLIQASLGQFKPAQTGPYRLKPVLAGSRQFRLVQISSACFMPVPAGSNQFWPAETGSNRLRLVPTGSNWFQPVKTASNRLRPVPTSLSQFRRAQVHSCRSQTAQTGSDQFWPVRADFWLVHAGSDQSRLVPTGSRQF